MFYLSEYFEQHKNDYYAYLQGISKQDDWLTWIKFFLTAVIKQADASSQKIQEIQTLYKKLEKMITEMPAPKYYIKVLNFIFSAPVFSTGRLVNSVQIPRSTCSTVLTALSNKGVIRGFGRGKSSVYFFDDLLKIIR